MMHLEPGQPCPYCAVRPDVPCRHRSADPTWQNVTPTARDDKRKDSGKTQARDAGGRLMGLA